MRNYGLNINRESTVFIKSDLKDFIKYKCFGVEDTMTEVQGYKVGDTIIVDNSVEFEILWFEQNLFKAPKTKHRAYLKQTNPIAKSNGLSYDKSFSIDELLVRAKIKE